MLERLLGVLGPMSAVAASLGERGVQCIGVELDINDDRLLDAEAEVRFPHRSGGGSHG